MSLKLTTIRRIILDEMRAVLKKRSLFESRVVGHSKGSVLSENIGFPTPRPTGRIPTNYAEFREDFARVFERMNLTQLSGRAMNLNESNAVINGLDRMWATVEREMTGKLGVPPPVFKEGREFYTYFANELEDDLTRMIESTMHNGKLAKGSAVEVAKSVLDALKAGY